MIKVWDVTIPQLSGDEIRRAYVYLPKSYEKHPEKRYPVMYMFDGHNVFFDDHATYGKSWGMGDYLDKTGKELIVAAVECTHQGNNRLSEYSPVSFANEVLGKVRGRGREYMTWMLGTFKPQIDRAYRTLPDRRNTLICGSSMGGLMALYAAVNYNNVFQRAACLSPSLWVDTGKVLSLIARGRMKTDTCIYMDYGSRELFNHNANTDALVSAAQLLLIKQINLTLRIVPGGDHSEASWERQIPVFMDCLGI